MKEFRLERGPYNLPGGTTDVVLVIDTKAPGTIAGIVIPGESGTALIRALLEAGAQPSPSIQV
jgi:hypothetical protein